MSLPARPVTELPRTVPIGLARRAMSAVQRLRTSVVFGFVLLLFAALLVRLVKVQLVGGAGYRDVVAGQHSDVRVQPPRAPILDRADRPLALSRPVRHVLVEAGGVANRKTSTIELTIEDVGRFATTLSEILDGVPSAKDLRDSILRRRRDGPYGKNGTAQVVVRRNVDDPRVVSRLDDARSRLAGLVVRQADRRDYPNGSWGGTLIGVARAQDADRPPTGIYGIEEGLDRFLASSAIHRRVPVDGRGRRFVIPRAVGVDDEADGRTAWLSMDLVIQGFCEQAIDALMAKWAPRGAVAIVMDPHSGDVLAIAQRPGSDPSSTQDAGARDLASAWTTEVGSTFKPITAARALEAGVVSVSEVFELPRAKTFSVPGAQPTTVRDAHEGEPDEPGTLVAAIAHSNNPTAAEWAYRLGAPGMRRLLADVGVESTFPLLGLTGKREAKGRVEWARVGAADHLRWAYGHGFTMTPLRLAATFCAFARDDFRTVTPRLVLAVGGETVPDLPLGPCLAKDPAHRALLRRALRAVVTEGTGKAHVDSPSLEIAGKTGTAKKPVGDGAYYSCSFVGYAPADRPRLVCLVMAQEPRSRADGAKPYGGAVAGPAVRWILEKSVCDYLGVPRKDAPVEPSAAEGTAGDVVPGAVPAAAGLGGAGVLSAEVR